MPGHDGHEKIARVMFSLRAGVLAHTARVIAMAERWLRPADKLDYVIRRWLIPVPFEDGTRSMPHKEASMRSSVALSPVQAAIGRHLRAEYAIERSMPAPLANLIREFEQRDDNTEAISRDVYASAT
jgi:hypothetical protein